MLEGEEVRVLEGRQRLATDVGVDVTVLFVLSPLFRVLLDEIILVEGEFPRWNFGSSTRVGWVDRGELSDNHAVRRRQDETKVAVLAPYVGNLSRFSIHSEDMMGVLYERVVWFPWVLG